MASECTGDVFKFSPHSGATLLVHLALADSVMDLHDYEMWSTQDKLAQKARVSRETVSRALTTLVAAGHIELLEDNGRNGKPNRYRYLFIGGVTNDHTPCDERSHQGVTNDHTPCDERSHQGVTNDHTELQSKATKIDTVTLREDFEWLWKRYPKKDGKNSAWTKYLQLRRKKVSHDDIVKGVRNYVRRCRAEGRTTQYMKGLAVVLGPQSVWRDELERTDPIDPNSTAPHVRDAGQLTREEFERHEREVSARAQHAANNSPSDAA